MKKFIFITSCVAFLALSFSCSSVPKEIPTDKTLEELKLQAYEYSAKGKYDASEKYYRTIIERFGTNVEVQVSCEFEIAHLYVKQKKFNKAEPLLNKVLSYYEIDPSLPAQYKKLAALDLQKVKDHNEKNKPKAK